MLLRVLLLSLFAFFAVDAQAASVTLLGRSIEIVIPNGYCEAGNNPADAEMVRRVREGIGNSNQIIVMFADCRELGKFRRVKGFMLDNYGQILAQTPKGQLRAFKGVTRPEFIQKMGGKANFNDAFKKADARLKQVVPSYQSGENLGLLSTDSNGLYIGVLSTITDDDGKPRTIVGVLGMTLVKELAISINLYQAYQKSPDLRGLLVRQQSAMAGFVRANN
ncbi:MAG: hypothetical protein V1689_04165 [Pseudomonadota bacterium]